MSKSTKKQTSVSCETLHTADGHLLPPSPVHLAFSDIRWNEIERSCGKLFDCDIKLLSNAEKNPIEYTLTDHPGTLALIKVLLNILSHVSGPSGPSPRVSRLSNETVLSVEKSKHLLYEDDTDGVVTHYVVYKLQEIILCLVDQQRNHESNSNVGTISSTFYQIRDNECALIDEWRPLMRVLHLGGNGDAFTQRGSAFCLAHILMAGCSSQQGMTRNGIVMHNDRRMKIGFSVVEEPLQALVSWIASQLQSSASTPLTLVIPTLRELMKLSEARIFFARFGGIGYLSKHLRNIHAEKSSNQTSLKHPRKGGKVQPSSPTVQQLYELCYCLWIMTFECNNSSMVRNNFARSQGAVHSLVDLVIIAPREKVVRVALSALRNLALTTAQDVDSVSPRGKIVNGSSFLSEMVSCGFLRVVENMKQRQWSDPDIVDDIVVLHALLIENYKDMSRWDMYETEVASGMLTWGILHKNDFFKANFKKFEGPNSDFATVKMLIKLVSTSVDDDVIAIAINDIGQFVQYYPNGRAISRRLGAKNLIMNLIEHDNPEVQLHALQCVSKMMVQNWQFVS